MRTSGINTLAAPVGERGRPVAPEQCRQPSGQIAADHIAVVRISGPARHEMRQDGGTSGKTALQRIFKVQQAQIIFAPLADNDLGFEGVIVRINTLCFADQLALQRLGKG